MNLSFVDQDFLDTLAEEDERQIVRVKQFSVNPMNEQEAIEQMELLGHDFFVFFNGDLGRVNVLYRRSDSQLWPARPSSGLSEAFPRNKFCYSIIFLALPEWRSMQLQIDGARRQLVPLQVFQKQWGLPVEFGITYFELKDWAVGRLDTAGQTLIDIKREIIEAAPKAITPTGLLSQPPRLAAIFRQKLRLGQC